MKAVWLLIPGFLCTGVFAWNESHFLTKEGKVFVAEFLRMSHDTVYYIDHSSDKNGKKAARHKSSFKMIELYDAAKIDFSKSEYIPVDSVNQKKQTKSKKTGKKQAVADTAASASKAVKDTVKNTSNADKKSSNSKPTPIQPRIESPVVLGFGTVGSVPAEQAAMVTKAFVKEYRKATGKKVISGKDVVKLLNSRGYQERALCATEDCAKKISSLLKAPLLISGRLTCSDSIYKTDVFTIYGDTAGNLTESSVYSQRRKGIDSACTDAAVKLAFAAAKIEVPEKIKTVAKGRKHAPRDSAAAIQPAAQAVSASILLPPTAPAQPPVDVPVEKGTGSAMIRTVPDSAQIYMEGLRYKGVSPLLIEGITPGKHIIRAIKDQYMDATAVEIKTGEEIDVNLEPDKQITQLEILSIPDGAKIKLAHADGSRIGRVEKSPAFLMGKLPDMLNVLMSMDGYKDTSASVRIIEGMYNSLTIEMTSSSYVEPVIAMVAETSVYKEPVVEEIKAEKTENDSISLQPMTQSIPDTVNAAVVDTVKNEPEKQEKELVVKEEVKKEEVVKAEKKPEVKKPKKEKQVKVPKEKKEPLKLAVPEKQAKPDIAPEKPRAERRNLLQNKTAGVSLWAGSMVALVGGGVIAALAREDYNSAQEAYDYLEKSSVGGDTYNTMLEQNQDKANAGNVKSGVAGALLTIGAGCLTFGIAFYF